MKFEEFLNRTSKAFRSVDLRIAYIKNDNNQNALLILRLSPEDPCVISAKQQKLKDKWDKFLKMKRLHFLLETYPFNHLDSLIRNIGQGFYDLQTDRVNIGEPIDLLHLESEFPGYQSWIKAQDSFPYFTITAGKHIIPLYNDTNVIQEIWMNGLQVAATGTEPYILLKELLGIDDYRGGTGFNLLLNAPFLACIKPKGPFDGRIYTLQVQFHESFNDELKLNAHLENKTSGSSIKQVFGPFIISSPHSHREYPWLREWTSQIELANIEDGDSLRINLVHTNPNPLVLDEFSDTGISLLTLRKQIQIQTNPYVDIKNPLMAALYRCVPKEELANYFSYKDTKHPQEHAQGIFEQKISKILTGSGFSVMRLGNTKYEKLKDKDDPSIVRSSIDLIAYSESKKHLLVVGCTLASPGERDVGDIAEARLTLLEEVFKDSRIELTPVIFTEAKTIENKIVRGVKLIDAKDIQYLINKLSQNEATEDISSFIISIPSPPPAYEL